ncbi:MAG: alanine racemase [Deferribacterales bacterium]
MIYANYLDSLKEILGKTTPRLPDEHIENTVDYIHSISGTLKLAKEKFGSPLYIIDEQGLLSHAERFMSAFSECFERFQPFFAMKSNNHSYIIKTLSENGYGIDVSSGAELTTALKAGADRIVFSGPGKTQKELALAVKHSEKVTVLMDSLNELEKLSAEADRQNRTVRAGVRITTQNNPLWRKFGIAADSLPVFMDKAAEKRNIDFCGLQFHSSWNLTPDNHVRLIETIGHAISGLSAGQREKIKFLDMGGGYWVEDGEWMLADTAQEIKVAKHLTDITTDPLDHRYLPATDIRTYARALSEAFNKHIRPLTDCDVYAEPGRFVAHHSMHLLLSVEDIKEPDIAITDGATNILGWERYEMDYFPVVNITSRSKTEKPMMVLGSLCTPHDVWGAAYHGESMNIGDTLIIPYQGAYTYCLRQNFIKDIPESVVFRGSELFKA